MCSVKMAFLTVWQTHKKASVSDSLNTKVAGHCLIKKTPAQVFSCEELL